MPPPIPTYVPVLTNPLSLYRSLIAHKQIHPDPSQHRLAIHLQKLYLRLIDYSPKLDYGKRLKTFDQIIEKSPKSNSNRQLAVLGHPIRRNPIFSHLFSRKERHDSLALTRVFTNYEDAIKLDSPQGLLVHGEVGSGKSMLVNLLAEGLPTQKKKKWHFDSFILHIFEKLEQLRRSRASQYYEKDISEHSMLLLAKDLIEKSPILFIDEFQLPDRVASIVIDQLLTAFFQLGGVLIATSNRMPDELSRSSGADFPTPRVSKPANKRSGLNMKNYIPHFPNTQNNDNTSFVDMLKARCEIWNMEGERDWRRREAVEIATETSQGAAETEMKGLSSDFLLCKNTKTLQGTSKIRDLTKDPANNTLMLLPQRYFLNSTNNEAWENTLRSTLLLNATDPITWESITVTVYARELLVPRHLNGLSYWNFSELCEKFLGPADYITLASNFHTFVLDQIPILSISRKNEARRFITLLDALYESHCKLILRAEVGPDDLFFPELTQPLEKSSRNVGNDDRDSVYSETIAEIYQDKTSPFRPNVSAYTQGNQIDPESKTDPSLASVAGTEKEIGRQVDFSMISSFIGEDERFAYKRAQSRLWQMCGARWHARSEQNCWKPLQADVRGWEHSITSRSNSPKAPSVDSDIQVGEFFELDRPAGLQGLAVSEKEFSHTESLNPVKSSSYLGKIDQTTTRMNHWCKKE